MHRSCRKLPSSRRGSAAAIASRSMMAAALDQLAAARPRRSRPRCHWRRSRRRGWRRRSCRRASDGSASSETKSAGAPAAMPRRPGAERLRAAGQRRVEQRAAGRAAGRRQHVARAMRQPLRIFELPQFVGDADQHVGIRADAEAAAMLDEQRRGEDAVAEIGFGDRAEPGDRAASRHARRSRPRSCGSRGSGTSARRPAHWRAAIRPAARPTRRRSPRPPSPARRRGCGSGRRRPARRRRQVRPASTARRLCGATPTTAPSSRATALAARLEQPREASRSLMNRRWPSFGAAPPKPECA